MEFRFQRTQCVQDLDPDPTFKNGVDFRSWRSMRLKTDSIKDVYTRFQRTHCVQDSDPIPTIRNRIDLISSCSKSLKTWRPDARGCIVFKIRIRIRLLEIGSILDPDVQCG